MLSTTAALSLLSLAGLSISAPIQRRANQGQATFFAVGLGNCGWQSSPGDMVVAVPTARYGSTSQKSGLCGQTVHITNTNTGISQDAKIVDSCPSCGSANDLDMSTGLFHALGGTTQEGVFPISWTMGSGGSSQPQQQKPKPKPTHASPSSTPAPTQASPSSSSNNNNAASTPSPNGPVDGYYFNSTTGFSNQTVSGVPLWWASIDSTYCNVTVAANETVAAIGPSQNIRNGTDLHSACGKLIEVTNVANNKTVNATITSWLPELTKKNTVVLADAYKQIADMTGDFPNPIVNVTWAFV